MSREIDVMHTPPKSTTEEKGNETDCFGQFYEPILNDNFFVFEWFCEKLGT